MNCGFVRENARHQTFPYKVTSIETTGPPTKDRKKRKEDVLVRDLQSNFPEAGEPRKGAWAELTHHSPFPRGTRGSFILVFSFMYSILELTLSIV